MTLIGLRPKQRSIQRLDQLCSQPHAVSRPSQAALNQELGAELSADTLYVHLLVVVFGGQGATGNAQFGKARQLGDDLLREGAFQEARSRIAGRIVEAQHRDSGARRHAKGRGRNRDGRQAIAPEEVPSGDRPQHNCSSDNKSGSARAGECGDPAACQLVARGGSVILAQVLDRLELGADPDSVVERRRTRLTGRPPLRPVTRCLRCRPDRRSQSHRPPHETPGDVSFGCRPGKRRRRRSPDERP